MQPGMDRIGKGADKSLNLTERNGPPLVPVFRFIRISLKSHLKRTAHQLRLHLSSDGSWIFFYDMRLPK